MSATTTGSPFRAAFPDLFPEAPELLSAKELVALAPPELLYRLRETGWWFAWAPDLNGFRWTHPKGTELQPAYVEALQGNFKALRELLKSDHRLTGEAAEMQGADNDLPDWKNQPYMLHDREKLRLWRGKELWFWQEHH